MAHRTAFAAAALSALLMCPVLAGAQPPPPPPPKQVDGPPPMTNLKVFPKDAKRQDVIRVMREVCFALNLHCEDCHVDEEEGPNPRQDFASDEKPLKKKARAMMLMTKRINDELMTEIPDREKPPIPVKCVTCHHGLGEPVTLVTHLREVFEHSGAQATVDDYRELRKDAHRGRYDFGEHTLVDFSRGLAAEGKNDDALAFLTLNAEFYPESMSNIMVMSDVQAARGERATAIELLKKLLAMDPENDHIKKKLDDLEAPPVEQK